MMFILHLIVTGAVIQFSETIPWYISIMQWKNASAKMAGQGIRDGTQIWCSQPFCWVIEKKGTKTAFVRYLPNTFSLSSPCPINNDVGICYSKQFLERFMWERCINMWASIAQLTFQNYTLNFSLFFFGVLVNSM